MAKLFVLAAPSGAGKTTIAKRILDEVNNLTFSISATTRKPRENEQEGKDYFFLSEEEFVEKIKNNEFIEWEKFYDYYYGTLSGFVDEYLNKNISVLLDVDVKGALNIKRNYPDSITIFIMPPSIEELEKRLRGRQTETEDEMKKRIQRAEMELKFAQEFDFIVLNDDLEKAINEVKNIINQGD